MTFFNDVDVFYINLESRTDRLEYIKNHLNSLNIINAKRVEAITPKLLSEKMIKDGEKMGVTQFSVAGSYSHLMAMKEFLETSDKEYALILEDDADLSNVSKVKFTVEDMFSLVGEDVGCLQLAISYRLDYFPNFKMRPRANWDFCAAAYIVTREYAKKEIDTYMSSGHFDISKFKAEKIVDYRSGKVIKTIPVPESIVYNLTNTFVFPIFTYVVTPSSISFSTEAQLQELKSKNDFTFYWSLHKEITIKDML